MSKTSIHTPNSGEIEKEQQLLKDIQVYLQTHTKAKINIQHVQKTATYLQLKIDVHPNEITGLVQGLAKRGAEPQFIDGGVWIFIKRPRALSLLVQGGLLVGLALIMVGVIWHYQEEIRILNQII